MAKVIYALPHVQTSSPQKFQ